MPWVLFPTIPYQQKKVLNFTPKPSLTVLTVEIYENNMRKNCDKYEQCLWVCRKTMAYLDVKMDMYNFEKVLKSPDFDGGLDEWEPCM